MREETHKEKCRYRRREGGKRSGRHIWARRCASAQTCRPVGRRRKPEDQLQQQHRTCRYRYLWRSMIR
eukprot:5004145-Pleurochrysis_carterae.AAC.1